MIGELSIINEWIPEQMEPGTVFVLENAGSRRKRRSLLGGAFLPLLRYARPDHSPTDGGDSAYDLRIVAMLRAIFY